MLYPHMLYLNIKRIKFSFKGINFKQLALILINLPIIILKGNNIIWGIAQAFLIKINISKNYQHKTDSAEHKFDMFYIHRQHMQV